MYALDQLLFALPQETRLNKMDLGKSLPLKILHAQGAFKNVATNYRNQHELAPGFCQLNNILKVLTQQLS